MVLATDTEDHLHRSCEKLRIVTESRPSETPYGRKERGKGRSDGKTKKKVLAAAE